MKKIVLAIIVLFNIAMAKSQSELDVLKYIQTDITGTARYMGMAGAFGSLGGDATAVKDNPAGLGVFRTSELAGTFSFDVQNGKASWNGVNTQSDNPFRVGFNNFACVLTGKTWRLENNSKGLLYSNWSFGYNRLKSFDRAIKTIGGSTNVSITDFMAKFSNGLSDGDLSGATSSSGSPYDNFSVPWLSAMAYDAYLIDTLTNSRDWVSVLNGQSVIPTFNLRESGYVDQFTVAWAGNVNNNVYFGASLNFQNINYLAITNYNERFGNNESLLLSNEYSTSGSGFNLNLGTIIRPTDNIRFGLSFRTPTVYSLTDSYYSNLKSEVVYQGKRMLRDIKSPSDAFNYFKLQGPIQLNGSASLLLGKKGLISGEYNYSNFVSTRLMTKEGDMNAYAYENEGMKYMLNDSHTFKVGGEFKVNPNFALRAGYAYMTPSTKLTAQKIMIDNTIRTDTEAFLNNGTKFITGGFGYREESWYIDFAYMYKVVDESFVPFNMKMVGGTRTADVSSILSRTHTIAVTLGLKFNSQDKY